MRSLLKQKKGELTDILIFIITLFILGVGLFIFMFIIPHITNGLKLAGMNMSTEGANAIASMETLGTSTLNNGFLILFIGLVMSIMVTSFMVRTHPIFIFLYLIFLGITIMLSFYLGNIYHTFITNPAFDTETFRYTTSSFSNWVFNYIAEITVAVGLLSIIIIFSKFSTYGGSQPM
jgi:hypothetical protein